ncbi:DUF255 domain-containing protein [Flavobacterium sp. NST-5]|uniref:DUF255 domain-containing protein n=2 Tax=Flavobacterium ichthyis TaxID=2698827 RepID=A0ABW9Z846_9FLAO|nr:DUF255 domain-containing protein [Flavobacterium ichthyis]
MAKNLKYLVLIFFLTSQNFAQLNTYTFEQAEKLSVEKEKPLVIFINTSWCKICKMMENSTFKNQKIIDELNQYFYFIHFDAEEKRPVIFQQKTFKYKPKGKNTGIHELAENLSNQTYPTITILKNNEIMVQIESYSNANDLLKVLAKVKIENVEK